MAGKSNESSTGSDSDATKDDGRIRSSSPIPEKCPPRLFLAMTKCPYPFLVTLPFLFTLVICLGLSRPSLIEEDVAKLWIPTDGNYNLDLAYAELVGAAEDEMSTFMAMTISRHGNNLFTEGNLNAIVERMQRIETATVTHKGVNYTWNDICMYNGLSQETTYQMPCLRLSPMDFFEEARWYFTEEQRVTWYKEIRRTVIKPLLIRYGIAQDKCISDDKTRYNNPTTAAPCDHAYMLRIDSDYAVSQGYTTTHAGSVLDFLHDLFSLPLHDTCRICIDENTEPYLQQLKDDYVVPAFTTLTQQLRRFLFALEGRDDVTLDTLRYVEVLIKETASIATRVTLEEVEDFYMYYTLRSLYGEGALGYQEVYREVNDPLFRSVLCGSDTLLCPPEDVTLQEATEALLRHADNQFSSTVSFGAPFPFWGSFDGTGHLFAGTFPVSGSGVNMSAPFDSLKIYLDLDNRQGQDWRPFFYDGRREDGFVDPLGGDYLWDTMVETNPVYSWFMAEEEVMTAHCGNGNLLGTNASDSLIDLTSAAMMKEYSQHLCTKHSQPFEVDGTRTRQHFARMWYDMLIDSPFVLDIRQGDSDPYSWTTGAGCGYDLGYSRFSYTGQSENIILQNASAFLYNIDEGAEIGVIDTTTLLGDVYPPIGEYSFDNPLQHVGLLQNVYATLVAEGIVERVQHKNRPGGPLNITEEDAREVLRHFKASFESIWTEGWDDDSEELQFVCFFDDAGTPGTLGAFLNSVTKSSGLLTAVAIFIIAGCSATFLASCDPVKSRIGITLIGVLLVILSFFASVGLGVLMGIKVNLTIAWTLPFIMLGLGVDNLYIILMSLEKQQDYTEKGFFNGMKEVLVPITMTAFVNASMLLVMNINSIPAVYLTAQVAVLSIVFLYVAIILCFPAYAYFDMKRQKAGRYDLFFWNKVENPAQPQLHGKRYLERLLYDRCYKQILFGAPSVRIITHSLIWALAALLLALGLYGISQSTVGLGLEDFLPSNHQGHSWASARSAMLGSWVVTMNWPDVNYTNSDVQMRMIQQFERVIDTPHIEEVDTRMLWIAEFGLWTSRLCDYNAAPGDRKCGRDQVFEAGSSCAGTWKLNTYGLRQKYSTERDDQCQPYDGGICVQTSELHPTDLLELNISVTDNSSWCPVFEAWSISKTEFCLRKWHEIVGGEGSLVLNPDAECEGEFCKDHMVQVPIPYSSGPPMAARDLVSHALTLEMMQQTRAVCDQDPHLHCWMSGPPFDFWSQYEGIQMNLVEIAGASVLIGLGISFVFFAMRLCHDGHHRTLKVFIGSLVGAMLIGGTCFFCLISVIGLSILAGVSLTAFSIMSFILSTAFAVEYCAHIVAKWLRSDRDTALERVEQTMSFLMLPTFMSFGSTAIGVLCLSMTDFEFNTRFFFRPLIISVFVTYFFGCWALPSFLSILDFDIVKLGPKQKNVQLNISHLSKLQKSDSNNMEPSNQDEELNRSHSDINVSHPSDDKMNCIGNTLTETETSLEFLNCYNISDCGGPDEEANVTTMRIVDDNSLLSEVPPPLYALSAHQAVDNMSKDTSSLSSYSSNYRSAITSVSSSQLTVEVDNTLRNLLSRKTPARSLLPAPYLPYQEEEMDAPSLADSLLAESVDATSTDELTLSVTSNAFDGIESSSQDDKDVSTTSPCSLLHIDPRHQVVALSSTTARRTITPLVVSTPPSVQTVQTTSDLKNSVNIAISTGEKLTADTCPREILTIVGLASPVGNAREHEDTPGVLEGGLSALRQHRLSSPRKKKFNLVNSTGIVKTSGSPKKAKAGAFRSNEVLKKSNDELSGDRQSGFDFEQIAPLPTGETESHLPVQQQSDIPSPPRSIHSMLTGGDGDVVIPIFEDDDTVNF